MPLKREDDFAERRKHLKTLSDEELEERFWKLTEQIVEPLLELAETHTSESVERSVLLRMGFNSLDAKAITGQIVKAGLLGKGAGHVVMKLAEKEEMSVKEAGLALAQKKYGENELRDLFTGGDRE